MPRLRLSRAPAAKRPEDLQVIADGHSPTPCNQTGSLVNLQLIAIARLLARQAAREVSATTQSPLPHDQIEGDTDA